MYGRPGLKEYNNDIILINTTRKQTNNNKSLPHYPPLLPLPQLPQPQNMPSTVPKIPPIKPSLKPGLHESLPLPLKHTQEIRVPRPPAKDHMAPQGAVVNEAEPLRRAARRGVEGVAFPDYAAVAGGEGC